MASAALAAGILGAVAFGVFWPVDAGSHLASKGPPAADPEGVHGRQVLPLQQYALIWQRPLRNPLYDPSPVAAKLTPEPQLKGRLAGTVVEPGFTYAFFNTADGRIVRLRVGDKIEGAEVKSIADGSVTVLFAGDTLTLTVERKETR